MTGVTLVGFACPERDAGRVLMGSAQVMLSLARLSSMGVRLPIHTSSAKAAPVASIFMPEMVTPSSRASPVKISRLRIPEGGVTAIET